VALAKSLGDLKRLVLLTYEEERDLVIGDIHIEVLPVWKWLLEK
jgi:predicted AAA+ superfamily ATPase